MKIHIFIIIITLTHTFHILTYILMTQFFIRLPGEAQKIERIMDAFSAQFHANNPWSFRHADTAFKLAYSVMITVLVLVLVLVLVRSTNNHHIIRS